MSKQIISFPFPQVPPEECEYFRDGVFQLKLQGAQLLNDVNAGTYTLSTENIRAMRQVNELCLKVGISPLKF